MLYESGIGPGEWVWTFKVSTGGESEALNPTFTVTQELIDPCDPPNSLGSELDGVTDQQYIVTDTTKDY